MNIPIRLVISAVRRPPLRQMVFFLAFPFGAWFAAALGHLGLGWAIAVSLSEVAMLGPMSIGALAPKEVRFLPIARRDIWRAGWCASTIVAPAATMFAKCAAVLFAAVFNLHHVSMSLLSLSLVLDIFYAGTLIAAMPLHQWFGAKAERGHARAFFTTLSIAVVVLAFSGMIWPLAFHAWLPTSWQDVHGTTAVLVGLGGALCVFGYFFRPVTSMAPPVRVVRRSRQRPDVRIQAGRLTGLSRLFVDDAMATVTAASATVMLLIGIAAAIDVVDPGAKFFDDMGLLPFASARAFGRDAGWMLPWLGYSVINLRLVFRADSVAALYRHLCVLPFDTTRLLALIVVRRMIGWAVIWTVLIAVHVGMVGQWPASLRLDFCVCVVGIDQFAHALHLRYRWQVLIMFCIMPLAGVAKLVINRSPPAVEPWYVAIFGLTGLVVAMVMNYSTLRTRSGLYKPAIPTAFSGAYVPDPMTR